MEPGNEGPNDFLAGDDASDDASDGASDDGAAGESGGAEGGDASSGSQQGGGDDDAKGDGDDESIQVLTSAPELALNSSGNLSPRAIQTLSPMSALSGDEASLFHGEEDIEPSAQSKKRKRDSDLSPLDLLSDTAGRAMTPPPGSNGDASSSGNNVSSSGNSSTHNSKAPPETESHKRRRVDNGDSVEAEVEGDKEDGEDEGDDADDEDDDKDDEDLGPDVSDDLLARVYEKSHVLGACLWFADKELGAMHVGELHEVFTTLGVQPTVANISACQELMRKIRDWCTSDLRVLQRARSTTTNASQDQAASSMSDEESSTERNMPAAAVEDDVAPQESPQRKANQRFAQKKYRKFNLPFKIHVLDYYNAHGRDRQRAAKEFGVEYHTIYGWTKSEAKLRAQDARKRVRYANGGYPNSANGRYPPAPSPPIVRRSEQSREQTNGVSNAGPPPLERGSASVSKPSQQSADGASIVYNNVAANGPTAPSVSSSSTTSGPPQNSVTSAWHMHRDRKEQESDPSTSKPSAVPPVTAPAHPPLSSISPPTDTPTGASQEMTDEKLAASTAQDMYDQKVSKKYRIFNIKFKIQVLDYFHATNDDKKLAPQKFSVPYQTIYKWGRVEDKLRARHKALLAEEEHRALRAQAKLARQSMKKAREERRRLNRADELKYAQNAAASSPNAALPSSTPPQHRGLSDVLEQSSSAPTDEPSVKKRRLDPVKAEPGHGENGENGKRTPKKYKKFDDKFKIRALNWWHQNGRNRAKAAKQFGLEYHTFYAWTKQESHLRMAQLDRNPDVTIIDDVLHGAESDPSEAPSSSESEQFDSDSGASDTSVSSASYDSGPERPFPNIPRARPRLTDIGPPKSLRSPQAAEGKPFAPGFRTPGPSLASRMVMSQSGPTPPTATAPAASASSSSSSSSAAATPTPKAEAGASPALSTPSQPISAPLASNSSGKRRGRKRKAEVEAEWNSGNREHLWECPHCKGHVYKKSKSTHLKYCRHRDTSPERRGRRRTREEKDKDSQTFTPEYHPWASCRTVKIEGVDFHGNQLTLTTAVCQWCSRLGPRDFDGKKPKAFYRKPTPVSYLNKNGLNYIRWAKFRQHEDSVGHLKALSARAEKIRAKLGLRDDEELDMENYESDSSSMSSILDAVVPRVAKGDEQKSDGRQNDVGEAVDENEVKPPPPVPRASNNGESNTPNSTLSSLLVQSETKEASPPALLAVDAIKPPPMQNGEVEASEPEAKNVDMEETASHNSSPKVPDTSINERAEAIRADHLSFIKRHQIEMPKPEDSEDDDDDDE